MKTVSALRPVKNVSLKMLPSNAPSPKELFGKIDEEDSFDSKVNDAANEIEHSSLSTDKNINENAHGTNEVQKSSTNAANKEATEPDKKEPENEPKQTDEIKLIDELMVDNDGSQVLSVNLDDEDDEDEKDKMEDNIDLNGDQIPKMKK